MRREITIGLLAAALAAAIGGCAYRHYLGMHGPTVRLSAAIHAGVSADGDCLECHDPARPPQGPPTPHPGFTGCLKCHNDAP